MYSSSGLTIKPNTTPSSSIDSPWSRAAIVHKESGVTVIRAVDAPLLARRVWGGKLESLEPNLEEAANQNALFEDLQAISNYRWEFGTSNVYGVVVREPGLGYESVPFICTNQKIDAFKSSYGSIPDCPYTKLSFGQMLVKMLGTSRYEEYMANLALSCRTMMDCWGICPTSKSDRPFKNPDRCDLIYSTFELDGTLCFRPYTGEPLGPSEEATEMVFCVRKGTIPYRVNSVSQSSASNVDDVLVNQIGAIWRLEDVIAIKICPPKWCNVTEALNNTPIHVRFIELLFWSRASSETRAQFLAEEEKRALQYSNVQVERNMTPDKARDYEAVLRAYNPELAARINYQVKLFVCNVLAEYMTMVRAKMNGKRAPTRRVVQEIERFYYKRGREKITHEDVLQILIETNPPFYMYQMLPAPLSASNLGKLDPYAREAHDEYAALKSDLAPPCLDEACDVYDESAESISVA